MSKLRGSKVGSRTNQSQLGGEMRLVPMLSITCLIAFTQLAASADDLATQVVGSWKVVSFKVQIVGETDARDSMGPNPIGRIIFTADHRMAVFISRGDRKPPANEADAASLLSTMVAYTGRFRIEGDRVITTVDGAWNEIYKQRDQPRIVKLDGDNLTLITPEQPSAIYPGKSTTAAVGLVRERLP